MSSRTDANIRSKATIFSLLGHQSEAIAACFGPIGFNRHYHDTYSFGLVATGANVFGYRRRKFDAIAGTIGICDPGEVHDGGMAGIAWSYRSAFPSAEIMTAIAAELGIAGLPAFNTGHITDPLSVARLDRFLTVLFEPGTNAGELEEAGIDAFATIIGRNAERVRPQQRAQAYPRVAAAALQVIHDRWSDSVSLEQMAQAAGATRFATIRSVARATGLTPHAYLIQLRVNAAKKLLRRGMSLAAVAAEVGFVDQSHMSRAFSRRWGVPPGAFKQAYLRARGAMGQPVISLSP